MKLLLLPGLDGTGDLFAPLVSALPNEIDPVVVSYPGDELLGYAELKQLVRKSIPDCQPYALLGESFSGPIAVSLAAEKPGNLRALILSCSFVRSPSISLLLLRRLIPVVPTHSSLARIARNYLLGANSQELRQLVDQCLSKVAPKIIRHRIISVATADESEALRSVSSPTLYLAAFDDRLVGERSRIEISQILPETQIVQIAGSHLLLQSNPDKCAAEIYRFIQRTEGAHI